MMDEPMDRVEKVLAEIADRLLRFENGLEHLLEVSARNEELTGKIGALVIQHEDRIKRLEGR